MVVSSFSCGLLSGSSLKEDPEEGRVVTGREVGVAGVVGVGNELLDTASTATSVMSSSSSSVFFSVLSGSSVFS